MKIRIDHYNLTKNKYEEYHQELADMTLDELIELLHKIPQKDDFPNNPVNIITEDFIFLKTTEENIRIVPNITGFMFIPQLGDPFEEEKIFSHKPVKYNINNNDLRSFISKGADYKTSRGSIYRNLFLNGFFPCINIILIIITILIINLNIGIIISFSVLFSLSLFNLAYITKQTYKKPVLFRKLKYEILILDKLKPIDISHTVLSLSQCFYFIIFIIFSFYLDNPLYQNILWSIMILSSVFLFRRVISGYVLIKLLYLRAKLAKDLIQESILSNYYDDKVKEKNFYLSLYILVKSEKLIKFGLLSKLITIITFAFTLIPILIMTL